MTDDATEELETRTKRDWHTVRAWAEFAIALAALLVAIVSIWTTAQISGLEDYLHSEITRRNVELDEAALNARRLDQQVQQSRARLEELRATADRLGVSASDAQIRSIALLAEQQRMKADLETSRTALSTITNEIAMKEARLAEYRRSEVFMDATFTFSLRMSDDEIGKGRYGAYALDEMKNFGLGRQSDDKQALYERVRTTGAAICRSLANFAPSFPDQIETPKLGKPPGEPTGDGRYRMTVKEADEWYQRQLDWNDAFNKNWSYNSSIRKAKGEAADYVRKALTHCTCVALDYNEGTCEPMPNQPDLAAIIETKPQLAR